MNRTPRGFGIYIELVDRYDNEVRVQRSSLAGDRCCWIFCAPTAKSDFKNPNNPPSPHLTADMARQVAKALLEFADGEE